MFYLITISCQQKKEIVSRVDINNVIRWLPEHRVIAHGFEVSGKYGQLHYHAVIEFKGLYRAYIQYGDSDLCLSFRIHWVRVYNLDRAIEYVQKDQRKDIDWNIYMLDDPYE